jgi:hypothetical protein
LASELTNAPASTSIFTSSTFWQRTAQCSGAYPACSSVHAVSTRPRAARAAVPSSRAPSGDRAIPPPPTPSAGGSVGQRQSGAWGAAGGAPRHHGNRGRRASRSAASRPSYPNHLAQTPSISPSDNRRGDHLHQTNRDFHDRGRDAGTEQTSTQALVSSALSSAAFSFAAPFRVFNT